MSGLFDAFTPPEQSVYGTVARAASADPVTSHQAADLMNRTGTTARHCAIVLDLLQRYPGSTAVELHAAQGGGSDLDRVEVGRRLDSLVKAGQARQGEPRACSIKRAKMLTWFPIPDTSPE